MNRPQCVTLDCTAKPFHKSRVATVSNGVWFIINSNNNSNKIYNSVTIMTYQSSPKCINTLLWNGVTVGMPKNQATVIDMSTKIFGSHLTWNMTPGSRFFFIPITEIFTDVWGTGNPGNLMQNSTEVRGVFKKRPNFLNSASTSIEGAPFAGQMAVSCQNLPLGALSSRSAPSVLVGALFKKFGLFLNNPHIFSSIII